MTDLDPYEELGVPRDAPTEAVRRAYRKRAKKAHPDAGGSQAAFERLSRALTILVDPDKRAKFDTTGAIDEGSVNNDRAAAINILVSVAGMAVEQSFAGGGDPEKVDLVALMRATIKNHTAQLRDAHKKLESEGKKMLAVAARFRFKKKGVDTIKQAIESRGKEIMRNAADVAEKIRLDDLALVMVDDYSFDAEPIVPMMHTFHFGGGTAF